MSRRPPSDRVRPRPEALESRALLAAFAVTSAADDGVGSLRAAIVGANADPSPGVVAITFDIPGSGARTIALATALPTVTRPVLIDGTSEPGYAAGSGPSIAIDGRAIPVFSSGLVLSGGSTVEGLSIGNFPGGSGIQLVGGRGGNLIEGDYLGVAPDGSTAMPNARGVEVDSPGNTVGGTTPVARNLISGNLDSGVSSRSAPPANTPGNVVEGNFIGTDAAGGVLTTAVDGNGDGIDTVSAAGVITAHLNNLAPGQSVPLTVVATVTGPSPLSLTAGVSDESTYDPDFSNNEATATVTPTVPTASTGISDLSITGLALPSPTLAGGPADFKLTVTNKGTADATGVVVLDAETGGPHLNGSSLDVASVTPSQGLVASSSGTGNNSFF